ESATAMISSLTGTLHHVEEDRVHLRVGPMVYEAMIPASDAPLLASGVGTDVTFHTIFYLEGDASGGNLEPRLIAFLRKEDKRFFEKFITVKGIGPKKALKALVYPAGDIARAIEEKDARFLVNLPQIGKRMAELIVAELAGKVKEFATSYDSLSPSIEGAATARPSAIEEEAMAALMALGERRSDAEHLLERARAVVGVPKNSNDLVREMLRMRTTRAV
ncbi:MAG TPA: Holliday junction branch migration protein RuvA, partial [Humisphaera sp.]